MSSVDDRIVNMQFNNSQFQTGAADSTRSLQTLEQTIGGMGSSSGLSTMGSQVDQVSTRFSALQVAAVTALATIVNKAVEAGLSLLKSMTIDPLLQGFQEYETNLNSIQTIMANTGASVKEVGVYLDELNEYSDLTIYNFSQMAENIGRFTAAGVELRAATTAIKGLANTAALSGSNVQQLNTAMYQMSQALSTGTIRLMDWNSLANAGMGGENIRDALLATAEAVGSTNEAMAGLTSGTLAFRDSLQYGWLTADIFTDTMKVMAGTTLKAKDIVHLTSKELKELGWQGKKAGDTIAFTVEQLKDMGYAEEAAIELNRLSQAAIDSASDVKTFSQLIQVVKESIGSGWAKVFQNLFGNFEQAKSLWTGVSDVITGFVGTIFDSVNKVLGQWNRLGGYEALWSGIGNIFEAIGNLLQPFVTAFQAIVPTAKSSSSALIDVTKGFESFTEWLVAVTEKLDILTPILSAVFGAFGYIANVVGDVLQKLAPVIDLIGDLAAKMGDLAQQGIEIGQSLIAGVIEGMDIEGIKASIEDFANTIIETIKDVLGIASPAAELVPVGEAIVLGIAEGISKTIGIIGEALVIVLDAILELLPVIYMKLLKIPTLFIMALADALPPVRQAMVSIIETILGTIGDAIPAVVGVVNDLLGGIFDILTTNIPKLADVMLLATTELLNYLTAALPMFIIFGIDMVLAIVEGVADALPRIATAVGEIIGTLISAFVGAIGDLFSAISEELDGGMSDSFDSLDWAKIFNALIAGGLVAALLKISISVGNFLNALGSPLAGLTGVLGAMQQQLKAAALLAIAIAVGILAAALIGLSLLKSEQLNQGLGAITAMGIMLGTLLLALNRLPPGKMESATASLVALSGSLVLTAIAVRMLSGLSLEELAHGIGAIGASLAIFVGALYAMNKFGTAGPQAALALLAVAGAMLLMAFAIRLLAKQDLWALAKGVGALGLSLAIFVKVLQSMSSMSASVGASAASLLLIAGAMFVMATAISILAKQDLGELARGVGALGASLGGMVLALYAISKLKGDAVASSSALIIMAGAMLIMAIAIRTLGNLEWDEIAKGLVALAAGFAILLIAARIAADPNVAAGLTVLGGTILALGAAAFLVGAGLLAAATAFTMFAAMSAAGIAAMVAGLTALLGLLPMFATQLALAFVSFVETVADAAPRLREAFGTIIKEMLGTFRDALPELAKTINALIDTIVKIVRNNHEEIGKVFTTLIKTGLKVVRETVPDFVETGMVIIMAFLRGIRSRTDEMIDIGTDIVVKVINGIGNAAPRIITAASNTIRKFVNALPPAVHDLAEDLSTVGFDIAIAIAQGIYDGLITEGMDMVKDAATAVADALPDWMKKVLGIDSPSKVAHWIGEMFVEGLAQGISNSIGRAVGATVALANAIIAAGDKAIRKAANQASRRQYAAEKAAAKAKISERQAKAAEKAAEKAPKNKNLEEAAKKARKLADKQAKAAQAAQKRADAASQKVADVQAFRSADDEGKGDILNARAKELSDRAVKKLAEANAAALAAKKASGKERDRLKKEAEQAAKDAKRLAKQSKNASERANKFYAKSVKDRIEALKAEREAREAQEEFDNATEEEKIAILQDRMSASERRAKAAQKQSEALVKQAQKLAKTDAARSLRLLDRAERLAAKANAAADEAQQTAQDIENLSNQTDTGTSTATSFSLSKNAMEDAASAIDRYTKSLQQAEEAAAAATPVYQFIQTNTSPESLSPTEIYRQTKNLLSAAETKV